jgi:FADH2 O2-dependent halogenase
MTYDVAILGSGFAGSILAWILARQGMRVVILDRDRHPRFAIGESSTPLADMALLRIAARHGIAELGALARYGTWLDACPEVGCGLKRGFSYFHHPPGKPYADTPDHAASLLVAASASTAASDTHWLRADVDAWLYDRARDAGAEGHEGIGLERLGRDGGQWQIGWTGSDGARQVTVPVVVDSTGSGGALARAVGLERLDHTLLTRTGSVFSHFTGVGSWDDARQVAGDGSTVEPFRSDDAAQHHVIDDGWVWVLRFRGGLTSVGIVRPSAWAEQAIADPDGAWRDTLARHPAVADLLATARPVRPLAAVPRLSRLWSRAAGPGWALLPTTCGFVDPLHSTGIAHALSGVERLAAMLLAERHDAVAWEAYAAAVPDEVAWIDRLVSGCYAGLPDFDRFRQACLLFFLATVSAERSIAGGATVAERGFLDARNAPLRAALTAVRDRIAAGESFSAAALRTLVGTFDPVGLLDPAHGQRVAHTAAAK